jgi:hypothetical protein
MKVKHQGRSVPALMKSELSSIVELPVSYRREDFDKFLYSVIREEEGGASLTVLSLLARHDVDPWEAAEQLTRIPWRAAAEQLSLLIATRPSDMASPQVPDPIAIDLIAKLPQSSLVQRPITEVAWESLITWS